MATLYKIIDPTTNEVKYIGVTTLNLKKRLSVHMRKAKNKISTSKFCRWLDVLIAEGKTPIIEQIMTVPNEISKEAELILIQGFKLVGHDLLNTYKMH